MRLFFGNTYEYGYERSFSPIEMRALLRGTPCELVALDGFYAAYGVYRWRKYWQGFRWIAGALNRMSRLLDRVSNRAFSRMFGMEVFIAARKIGAA